MTGPTWTVYPEEWFHLHGKALSGHRHSHPMRDGEDRDEPDHWHPDDDPDGPAEYPHITPPESGSEVQRYDGADDAR